MTDDHSDTGKTSIPWDFQHWGDPDDYVGYDPEANYVDTLDTTLLDSVRDALLHAQDKGRIQNARAHYDDPRLSNLDEPAKSLAITTQDARALLELASTVEDRNPHEHEAVERVQQALEQHDQELAQSLDQSLNRGHHRGR
jgi:hypothetical protein